MTELYSTKVYVLGHAFFAPNYASAADAVHNHPRAEYTLPPFAWVKGRLRRFTSLVTQLQLEVAGAALAAAAVDASTVTPVFSSMWGEIDTGVNLMQAIFATEPVSAARFAQSVHNTPAGLFSMAARNEHPASVLAAGPQTFCTALLEALLLTATTDGPVLLTCADEAVPSRLAAAKPGVALAIGFVLSRHAPAASRRSLWELQAHFESTDERAGIDDCVTPSAPAHLGGSAVVPALHLATLLESAVDARACGRTLHLYGHTGYRADLTVRSAR